MSPTLRGWTKQRVWVGECPILGPTAPTEQTIPVRGVDGSRFSTSFYRTSDIHQNTWLYPRVTLSGDVQSTVAYGWVGCVASCLSDCWLIPSEACLLICAARPYRDGDVWWTRCLPCALPPCLQTPHIFALPVQHHELLEM